MRQLSHLLVLFVVLFHLNSKGQSDIQYDTRIDPLLKQVHAKHAGLRAFGRHDGIGGYVNMAVLAETSRTLKWFTCHGVAFDSLQLQKEEYIQIATGVLDPFTFYRQYNYESIFYIWQAQALYRLNGKSALGDTAQNNAAVYNSAAVKSAGTSLQKLIAMESLIKKRSLQLRLFDSKAPRQLANNRNDSNRIPKSFAGKMIKKAESTEYFNTDLLSSVAKIVLHRRSPDRLYVYGRDGALVDSVSLKSGKYASLLEEKEDVFLLYRGWLELQWQQIADTRRQYRARLHKLDSGSYTTVSWERDIRQLQDVAATLREQQISIDDKIGNLLVPEEKCVEELIAHFYRNETSEISYLQGLGFAYTTSYVRKQKIYELPDHRGNVMAVVSDGKKAVDENDDSITDYYNADVVNANDYYPFGMQMPGRAYSAGNTYRYGYNGKENDNEVKGEGNQQDYGMRIYDPRIGKFLSIDPLTRSYPMLTPFQFASNSPIAGVDLDGQEFTWFMTELLEKKLFGTTKMKDFRNGIAQRAVETATGLVEAAPAIVKKTLSDFNNSSLSSVADPSLGQKRIQQQVDNIFAYGDAVIKSANELWELGKKAAHGNPQALGAAGFEAAMLVIPGDEIRFARYATTESLVAKTIRQTSGREIITITKSGLRTDALKVAQDILGGLGEDAIGLPGKSTKAFPDADKTIVGMQSADKRRGWRVDYDTEKGAHINWFDNDTGEKGAIPFVGTEDQVSYLKQQLTKTYNNPN